MNKLALFLVLALVSTAVSGDCVDAASSLAEYSQNSRVQYEWNNCATAAKAYYDSVDTSNTNRINTDLAKCATYTVSDIRKKCETDNSLSTQTDIIKNYYSCRVDYESTTQAHCVTGDACDSYSDECDYNRNKEATSTPPPATSALIAYAGNANTQYKTQIDDLNLGIDSTKCTDIKTNCNGFTADSSWRSTCISIYQQKCFDQFLKDNFSNDLSYKTYICRISAAAFGFLAKFSLLALIAFFTF